MRRRFVILAMIAIGIGVGCLVYRGPGRAIVRGHVGDGGATMLVYAMLSIVFVRTSSWIRGAITMTIATAVELSQLVWHATSTTGSLLVGTTFDWWDFVAYVIGTLAALGWDRATGPAKPRA